MKKFVMSLARSKVGELIVGYAFEKTSGLLPVKRVKETPRVIAFLHPTPSYENHILIVPKKAIRDIACMSNEDKVFIEDVFCTAKEIVHERGWQSIDYSVITNGGDRQEVAQLHFHLISGKKI